MDAMLRALADRTRRQILAMVYRKERTAGEIAAEFSLTRPAISQHLAVLLKCELIALRREGTRRLYSANRPGAARLRSELESFWQESLRQLKERAEEVAWKGKRARTSKRTTKMPRRS
jgi:DNA-binding transcriptional ArsR family regulator